jgi:hypothetical protein
VGKTAPTASRAADRRRPALPGVRHPDQGPARRALTDAAAMS